MLHPLTTTGLVPMLLLLILNIRITTGIKQLQVSSICYYAHLVNVIYPIVPILMIYRACAQRYAHRVLQTIQTKLIFLCVWAAVVYQKPKLLAETESFQLSAFGFGRQN